MANESQSRRDGDGPEPCWPDGAEAHTPAWQAEPHDQCALRVSSRRAMFDGVSDVIRRFGHDSAVHYDYAAHAQLKVMPLGV